MVLFQNQITSANSSTVTYPGGRGCMFVDGTIGGGGGAIQLQAKEPGLPDSSFSDVDGTSKSSTGVYPVDLPMCDVRCVLSGQQSHNLNVSINPNPLGSA